MFLVQTCSAGRKPREVCTYPFSTLKLGQAAEKRRYLAPDAGACQLLGCYGLAVIDADATGLSGFDFAYIRRTISRPVFRFVLAATRFLPLPLRPKPPNKPPTNGAPRTSSRSSRNSPGCFPFPASPTTPPTSSACRRAGRVAWKTTCRKRLLLAPNANPVVYGEIKTPGANAPSSLTRIRTDSPVDRSGRQSVVSGARTH